MKNENVNVGLNVNLNKHLSLEGEGGTKCRVRGKVKQGNLISTPSSALRASSPSRGKGGFTLIELLVVVLIIGILVSVALPQYKKTVYKSRYAQLKPLVRAIANAEEVYYLANGKYTINFTDLDVDLPAPSSSASISTRSTYYYSWGKCELTDVIVSCINDLAHIQYGIGFKHSLYPYAGKQRCVVRDDNEQAKQICQQDSNIHIESDYIW